MKHLSRRRKLFLFELSGRFIGAEEPAFVRRFVFVIVPPSLAGKWEWRGTTGPRAPHRRRGTRRRRDGVDHTHRSLRTCREKHYSLSAVSVCSQILHFPTHGEVKTYVFAERGIQFSAMEKITTRRRRRTYLSTQVIRRMWSSHFLHVHWFGLGSTRNSRLAIIFQVQFYISAVVFLFTLTTLLK